MFTTYSTILANGGTMYKTRKAERLQQDSASASQSFLTEYEDAMLIRICPNIY